MLVMKNTISLTSRVIKACVYCVLLAWPGLGLAEDSPCASTGEGCVRVGEWEFSVALGVGGHTNPVQGQDNIPIFVMPNVSYYGERFFWQTDTLGYTLVESRHSMLNLIGTVSYDQSYFNDWGIGNFFIEGGGASGSLGVSLTPSFSEGSDSINDGVGTPLPTPAATPEPTPAPEEVFTSEPLDFELLHDRKMAGLVGFEYLIDFDSFNISAQFLQDASSVHGGKQARLAFSKYWLFEKDAHEISVGMEWKDGKTLDYYFGVRPDETENPRWVYQVGGEISYRIKWEWRHKLSKRWELTTIVHHRRFGGGVSASPIVEDAGSTAAFIGGAYYF